MTALGALVTLVPLTLFFLYKVISSSTKNSPSARVMRNLTQAAREVLLYFRVHVMAFLLSSPLGPPAFLASSALLPLPSPVSFVSSHPSGLPLHLPFILPSISTLQGWGVEGWLEFSSP